MSKFLPNRGDIIWLILDPRIGHEQSGGRPAIVLSPRLFSERTGLAVVCPITNKVKGLPFEVLLESTKTTGAALPIHIKSIDLEARKAQFIEQAPQSTVNLVVRHVATLIGKS